MCACRLEGLAVMLIALSPARARLPAHCEYAGAIGSHAERALALQDLFRPAAAGGRPGRAGQAGWTGAKKFGRAKKIFPGQQKKKILAVLKTFWGHPKQILAALISEFFSGTSICTADCWYKICTMFLVPLRAIFCWARKSNSKQYC